DGGLLLSSLGLLVRLSGLLRRLIRRLRQGGGLFHRARSLAQAKASGSDHKRRSTGASSASSHHRAVTARSGAAPPSFTRPALAIVLESANGVRSNRRRPPLCEPLCVLVDVRREARVGFVEVSEPSVEGVSAGVKPAVDRLAVPLSDVHRRYAVGSSPRAKQARSLRHDRVGLGLVTLPVGLRVTAGAARRLAVRVGVAPTLLDLVLVT